MCLVFELDAAGGSDSNDEVKKSFAGDCEDDEEWPESEKNDHMTVEKVFPWRQDMGKGQDEGCNCLNRC